MENTTNVPISNVKDILSDLNAFPENYRKMYKYKLRTIFPKITSNTYNSLYRNNNSWLMHAWKLFPFDVKRKYCLD